MTRAPNPISRSDSPGFVTLIGPLLVLVKVEITSNAGVYMYSVHAIIILAMYTKVIMDRSEDRKIL